MPLAERVDDPNDPRVADFVGLTDADLRRVHEHGEGIFIAEGVITIRQVAAAGARFRSILVAERRVDEVQGIADASGARLLVATQAVMDAVAGFPIHRGAVAAVIRPEARSVATVVGTARRIAVLEDVNDHENLGVVFRNAAALGIDAIVLSPRCADPYYRRSVRVSMGHVATIPFAVAEEWPRALDALQREGFLLVALTPAPTATPISEAGLGQMARVALLLGAEGAGLSAEVLVAADMRVRIPMARHVDSLNLASAAAIAFFSSAVQPDDEPATDDT